MTYRISPMPNGNFSIEQDYAHDGRTEWKIIAISDDGYPLTTLSQALTVLQGYVRETKRLAAHMSAGPFYFNEDGIQVATPIE
jgi:hypothetical protein